MNNHEKINRFFEEFKNIGFWKRIFNWKVIRELAFDAYGEYKQLAAAMENALAKISDYETKLSLSENDNKHLGETIDGLEKNLTEAKIRIDNLSAESFEMSKQIQQFKQTDESRKVEFEKGVASLNLITERTQSERTKEKEAIHAGEIKKLEEMKDTWQRHEADVKSFIKSICNRHSIEYVENAPIRGNPDNVIRILNDLIVFDAKSPRNDDLSYFNNYIKEQTEKAGKYANEDGVKNDIYLVIPSNAVQEITQFSYNVADYNVYIVTKDVLEPLILSLKKIEEYEFANELTPEERENLCRLIGKFTYINKRRIQIDQVMIQESLEILSGRNKLIPSDMIEKVNEFEKSEKINLPVDKRTKHLVLDELQDNFKKIQREINSLDEQSPDLWNGTE